MQSVMKLQTDDPVFIWKSLIDLETKIDPWFFPGSCKSRSWFQMHIENRIPIWKWKPRIDFDLKIADRCWTENRIPFYRSVSGTFTKPGFQSWTDLKMIIRNRLWSGKRRSICNWKTVAVFSGTVFDRDCDRDSDSEIRDRLRDWTPVQSELTSVLLISARPVRTFWSKKKENISWYWTDCWRKGGSRIRKKYAFRRRSGPLPMPRRNRKSS